VHWPFQIYVTIIVCLIRFGEFDSKTFTLFGSPTETKGQVGLLSRLHQYQSTECSVANFNRRKNLHRLCSMLLPLSGLEEPPTRTIDITFVLVKADEHAMLLFGCWRFPVRFFEVGNWYWTTNSMPTSQFYHVYRLFYNGVSFVSSLADIANDVLILITINWEAAGAYKCVLYPSPMAEANSRTVSIQVSDDREVFAGRSICREMEQEERYKCRSHINWPLVCVKHLFGKRETNPLSYIGQLLASNGSIWANWTDINDDILLDTKSLH